MEPTYVCALLNSFSPGGAVGSRPSTHGRGFVVGRLSQTSALGEKDEVGFLVNDIAQSNFALAPRAFGDEILD